MMDEAWWQQMLDREEPYDGKDPNTEAENRCQACHETKPNLLRCSRCQIIYYCNRECQRKHFQDHKADCKELERRTNNVKTEAERLIAEDDTIFETEVGDFWGLVETRNYMRARLRLANKLYEVAYEIESVEVWNKALHENLELLRLCSSDNIGVRFHTPFILLYLNRDDDAYAFCRYWINSSDEELQNREQVHRNSQESDWIYPRETDCKFKDIFQESPNAQTRYMSLAFLVAICIIKMRIVASYDAKRKAVEQVASSNAALAVPEVKNRVLGTLAGVEGHVVEQQRQQVERLLDVIHQNNPTMLPAILNPRPLKEQPEPGYTQYGHPSEAYLVLRDCNRAFVRVPGAEQRLEQRFGKNPVYDFDTNI